MRRSAELRAARLDRGYLLEVAGRATMHDSHALRAFLGSTVPEVGLDLVIDLSECSFLDSTFLGHILVLHKQLELGAANSSFVLVRPSEAVMHMLDESGLAEVLSIVEDCPQRIGEFIPLDLTEADAESFARHVLQCHQRLAEIPGPNQEVFKNVVRHMLDELDVE